MTNRFLFIPAKLFLLIFTCLFVPLVVAQTSDAGTPNQCVAFENAVIARFLAFGNKENEKAYRDGIKKDLDSLKRNPTDPSHFVTRIKQNLETSVNPDMPANSVDLVVAQNHNFNYYLCMSDFWAGRPSSFSQSEQQKYVAGIREGYADIKKRKDDERSAVEQRQRAELAADDQRKQAAAVQAMKQFRDSLGTMNPGQLFAKADELSSQGDTTKARETLRTLVSRFPNHPLAATAAQQMATMSSASANAGNSASVVAGSGSSVGSSNTGPTISMSCNDSFDAYIAALPNFSASGVRAVVQNLRKDSALLLSEVKAGKTTPSVYIPAYQKQIAEYGGIERKALENHKILSTGGLDKSICNPQDGTNAAAWAGTRLGVAFATWALNTMQCVVGQTNPKPLQAFCPF